MRSRSLISANLQAALKFLMRTLKDQKGYQSEFQEWVVLILSSYIIAGIVTIGLNELTFFKARAV